MLMSVGDMIADMQREDPGVTASVFSKGGSVHAGPMTFSTSLKTFLLQSCSTGVGRQRAAAFPHEAPTFLGAFKH